MRARTEAEIFCEIEQIHRQYKSEVQGNRVFWPKAIKNRVIELQELSVSQARISENTGISVQTLYSRNRKSRASAKKVGSGFLPVKIKPSAPPLVTGQSPSTVQAISVEPQSKVNLTIVTPSGYRIEGLEASILVEILLQLEKTK